MMNVIRKLSLFYPEFSKPILDISLEIRSGSTVNATNWIVESIVSHSHKRFLDRVPFLIERWSVLCPYLVYGYPL